ncbi:hypothetical protein HNY73_011100 [Argiope bruennichi]|uniref:Uncharacterized protein n=1 Tax=Argiope bruennichi TaxID=94029 RepID=A0A8T0F588_ARGBR|nr:hypothetical protein HNY73_011100 [Argiope bruennichi]
MDKSVKANKALMACDSSVKAFAGDTKSLSKTSLNQHSLLSVSPSPLCGIRMLEESYQRSQNDVCFMNRHTLGYPQLSCS